jgi:hypothetical protein
MIAAGGVRWYGMGFSRGGCDRFLLLEHARWLLHMLPGVDPYLQYKGYQLLVVASCLYADFGAACKHGASGQLLVLHG